MYQKLPNLVLGFHGCNKDTFKAVIKKGGALKCSNNVFDWLGNGIYFWEQNYARAYEWAVRYRGGKENAAVIGAVIDLGYCLNLTDSASADILREGYEMLKDNCKEADITLPQNRSPKEGTDILRRDLDCAVIQQIHEFNKSQKRDEFDSVRGVFTEGGPPYSGSAFCERTHIQLCIRNPNCIKGYFEPRGKQNGYGMP
ncbi:MAG: hypothetical protein HFE98_04370 [Ruminiclostridium sp.]|nr:hypothetical protein [Ruminiclostridium sp.]